MTTTATVPALNGTAPLTIKSLFGQDNVKKKFQELLGSKMQGFVASVLQCVASNDLLSKADPHSVLHAAAVAATLDLPLNNSLGLAYIVPYNSKQPDGTKKVVAQFQMGYKAFIQLAQRSGQFKTINSTDVREGEIKKHDRLSGEIEFDWIQGPDRSSKPIIGYVAYFRLLNGFEKPFYMSTAEVMAHGKEYSQSFKKGYGLWNDKFEAMANKTVIKLLLSKYAPLSVAMNAAMIADQAIIKDPDTMDVEYIDNTTEAVVINKEEERITLMIEDAGTLEDLEKLRPNITTEAQADLFADKREKLSTGNTNQASSTKGDKKKN